MSKNRMLIDASHPEETRVVVEKNGRVEEFDFEAAARKLLKGSIYLAKVTRVEPSLQAAFVDFGGNRHGFLAFNEIHPDYYQIPVADRRALLEAEAAARAAEDDDDDDDDDDDFVAEDQDDDEDEPSAADAHDRDDADDDESDDDVDDDDDRDDEDDDSDLIEAAAIDVTHLLPDEASTDADDAQGETAKTAASLRAKPLEIAPDERISADVEAADIGAGGETEAASSAHVADDQASDDHSAMERTADGATGAAHDGQRNPRPDTRNEASDRADAADGTDGDRDADQTAGDADTTDADLTTHTATTDGNDDADSETGDSETGGSDADARGTDQDDASRRSAHSGRRPRRRGRGGGRPRSSARSARDETGSDDDAGDSVVESLGRDDDELEDVRPKARPRLRSYKIQEVIKRRQIVLVQVVKEERGTKGAALTTYLSLAGRYTVLMPNTARGGGISRKITNAQDRKRLKAIARDLDVPEGMGLIIRTAGAARTKQEIKRDFEYLLRLWESVRDLTLNSSAPALVYEEGNLIKRAIRDLYTRDIEEVIVSGAAAYKEAKDFMRMLMPSHAKNVVKYEGAESLFVKFGVEAQLGAMFSPIVTLRSGGYLVINQTEALVAIDINSGKSTREFSIEETALKTNLEAADEIARQLKLRDLAGLIVVDFIDMDEKRNNRAVERKIKECLKADRARIQVGRISHFGLLEMSRQRLRTGVLEGSSSQCPHCQGSGIIRSIESVSLGLLREIEAAARKTSGRLVANAAPDVALYLLNQKRQFLLELEREYGCDIEVIASDKHQGASFAIEHPHGAPAARDGHKKRHAQAHVVSVEHGFAGNDDDKLTDDDARDVESNRDESGRGNRRRRRGRGNDGDSDGGRHSDGDVVTARGDDDDDRDGERDGDSAERGGRRGRRRGRRGGQRNRQQNASSDGVADPDAPQPDVLGLEDEPYMVQAATVTAAAAAARRGARSRQRTHDQADDDRGPRDGGRRRGRGGRGRGRDRDRRGGAVRGEGAAEVAGDVATQRGNGHRQGHHNGNGAHHAQVDAHPKAANEAENVEATMIAESGATPTPVDAVGRAAERPVAVTSNGDGTHVPAAGDPPSASVPAQTGTKQPVPETETAAAAPATDDAPNANEDASDHASAQDAGGEAVADTTPRRHWGQPISSTPVLQRLLVGDAAKPSDDDSEPRPRRRGWWQRGSS